MLYLLTLWFAAKELIIPSKLIYISKNYAVYTLNCSKMLAGKANIQMFKCVEN